MPTIKAPPKAFIYEPPPDRLGNNARTAFEKLKQDMGPRGATFLGRAINADDTLESVLKRIPAAELEEGGSTIKAVTSPEKIHGIGQLDHASSIFSLLSEPFMRNPGSMVKYLRRKIQEYTDPEGEIMEPRPPTAQTFRQLEILVALVKEQLKGEDTTLKKMKAIAEEQALKNKRHPPDEHPLMTVLDRLPSEAD